MIRLQKTDSAGTRAKIGTTIVLGSGMELSETVDGLIEITSTATGGGGGTVVGTGSAGYIPLWSDGTTIGNSVLSQSGTTVTVGGTLNATALQVGGVGVATGSGTAGYLPLWSNGTTIGNSVVWQSGTTVTVSGTLTADALQVSGAAVATQTYVSTSLSAALGPYVSVSGSDNLANRTHLTVERNHGFSAPGYTDYHLQLRSTDAGGIALTFHRSGYTAAVLRHDSDGGLKVIGSGVAYAPLRAADIHALENGWFRTYNSSGLYNQTHGMHWYADNPNFYCVQPGDTQTTTGVMLRDSAGTLLGYLYGDGSNVGILSNDGNWSVRAFHGGPKGGELSGAWNVTGAITTPSSVTGGSAQFNSINIVTSGTIGGANPIMSGIISSSTPSGTPEPGQVWFQV